MAYKRFEKENGTNFQTKYVLVLHEILNSWRKRWLNETILKGIDGISHGLKNRQALEKLMRLPIPLFRVAIGFPRRWRWFTGVSAANVIMKVILMSVFPRWQVESPSVRYRFLLQDCLRDRRVTGRRVSWVMARRGGETTGSPDD